MYEIITDASVDIEKSANLIPMNYMVGEDECVCTGLETEEELRNYYNRLRNKENTSTSQISPQTYIDYFEPYVKMGTGIIYISLAKGLSDTIKSAQVAVNMLQEVRHC